jgi:hypothetical protein
LTLLDDPHEEVRLLVSQSLGSIIAAIGAVVSSALVSHYCVLIVSPDMDVAFSAAYSFPAVALALGKRKWSDLECVFQAGIGSPEYRVRRSLAFGLLSFADLLQPERLRYYAAELGKDICDVAIGIIANLHKLLPILDETAGFVDCLTRPRVRHPKWRTRVEVARQLRLCASFFDREVLVASAKELLRDQVPRVRKEAVASFVELMNGADFAFVLELGAGRDWVDRLTAVAVFEFVKAEFVDAGADLLAKLAEDRVPNVRAAVARSFAVVAAKISDGEQRLSVAKAVLARDPDPDVAKPVADDRDESAPGSRRESPEDAPEDAE